MEDLNKVDNITIEVGALVEVLGGLDNLDLELSDSEVVRLVTLYDNPDSTTIELAVVDTRYLENYGAKCTIILKGVVVKDYNRLSSVMDIDEENGKIKSLVRCTVTDDRSISVIVVDNVSFEETFNTWFTLNAAMIKMLRKQNKLNIETNGDNYITGINKYGKPIDWHLCVADELSELLNSTPWKHWKDGKFNYQNIFTETVDIYHFLLSIFTEDVYVGLNQTGLSLEDTIEEAGKYERFGFIHFCQILTLVISVEDNKSDADIMDKILLDVVKYYVKHNNHTADNTAIMVLTLVIIFNSHTRINKSPNDFIKKYYAKNTLNQFRQDNGYGIKDGGYIKIWDGLEDNEALDVIMETIEVTEGLELDTVIYEHLEIAYKNVKADDSVK